jgi:hypothetical protein
VVIENEEQDVGAVSAAVTAYCIFFNLVLFQREALYLVGVLDHPISGGLPQPGSSKNRVKHVLDRSGFVFARSPEQFLVETAYATNKNSNSNDDEEDVLYSDRELKAISRAMVTMFSFSNQGLWSDGYGASVHFIGTGSCLVKLQRPAKEVAVGLMHGLYLQQWRSHIFKVNESLCDHRHRFQQVMGSDLEQELWLATGLFGNGPWQSCYATYESLVDVSRDETHYSKSVQLLAAHNLLKDASLHLLICDEIEEASIGGEAILSGHWKRRSAEFFRGVRALVANYLEEERLAFWVDQAQEMSHALFHPNPIVTFKELSPPSVSYLLEHNTTGSTFSPGAHPADIHRWDEMVRYITVDRPMLPKYNRPLAHQEALAGIAWSQNACDSVVAGTMTF